MGMKLENSAPGVKVRLWNIGKISYVLARCGKNWKVLMDTLIEDHALVFIEKYHADKEIKWSVDVKIKGGWVCRECGGGLHDRELLESHHIRPRHKFPSEQYDLENGECICLWSHALRHKDNPVEMNMILLRLLKILTGRHCRPFSICQRKLLGLINDEDKEGSGNETKNKS